MRFAVDTGGTFTDLLVQDSETLRLYKTSTNPDDPVDGILAAFDLAAGQMGLSQRELLLQGDLFIHGTTRAINAIITSTTALTALLTTMGHPDILVFREGGRAEPFNFTVPFPQPYIPRALTFQVPERCASTGAVLESLDETAVIDIIAKLRTAKVEAVAVCLLWSIVNPRHELRIGELLEQYLPGVPFTLSHSLNPSLREYRRASATSMDASLKPLMAAYLQSLQHRVREAGFNGRVLVVTSQGGMMDAAALAEKPIHTINSGPSMAPIAGLYFSRTDANTDTAIVTDAGGTTYDVSLVRRGRIPWTRETWIGQPYRGHMTGFPSVDVKSIGAGGGSVAWVDKGGLLHVGPQSAGAVPGPACYPHGGIQATVTDAALILGYLDPNYFLGGVLSLDIGRAKTAVEEQIATKLDIDLYAAASAILHVATENMVHAIEEITINQGINPADSVLIGGGGAAGLTAVSIARRLGCQRVIIPEVGAALSAAAALISDLKSEYRATYFTNSERFDLEGVNRVLHNLEQQCLSFLRGSGASSVEHSIEFAAEARYVNQTWEINVPLISPRFSSGQDVARLVRDFHAAHEELFAFSDPASEIEVISWQATVRCQLRSGALGLLAAQRRDSRPCPRLVFFEGLGLINTPVFYFESLSAGETIHGPAIIESPVTTVVIDSAASAQREASGSVSVLTRAEDHRSRPIQKNPAQARGPMDGVQLAIINSRFQSIARKMANTLLRSGRSGVLNTARDFSCCILTSDHELLTAADSLPIHVLSGPDLMARAMKEFHPDLRRGDAYLHNSPYHGCSHAADHTILVPVIDDRGVHHFTVLAKAHQADIGNALPTTYMGAAKDVYAEGALIFPAVKIQENYRELSDIVRMSEARIRVPEQWHGDYLAMIGASRIGEQEILALGQELGWETLHDYSRQWFDHSESRMTEAISRLPTGTATTQSIHDPFPGTSAEGITIEVSVKVQGSEGWVDVDLTNNIDCLPCGLNLSEACARTAALVGIFNSIDHTVSPNAGSFRRVRVRLRKNCIVGVPQHPTSCSVATTNIADRVANAVQRAVAELDAGHGLAEVGAVIPPALGVISGIDPRTGRAFVNQLFLAFTGGAGAPRSDAWLTMAHVGNAGLCCIDSVEVDEIRYPILVQSKYLVPNSEGAGRFRGAPSAYCEYGPLNCRLEVGYVSDGCVNPARGACGGLNGAPARQFKRARTGSLVELEACAQVLLDAGEMIVSLSCGGGGYGSPLERDPERVKQDCDEGLITLKRAKDVYGVIIDTDREIDQAATENYRKSLHSKQRGFSLAGSSIPLSSK